MATSRPLRIIQCGTGVAGRQALRAILDHPQLQLAGLLVHSAHNAGIDAGVLAGTAPTGILSTDDFEHIAAVDADAVCYMMLLPDADAICRLLAAGKNVVTTAGLMFPGWRDAALQRRLQAACAEGGSAFYATGINPGWVDEILPMTMSALCRRIEHIHIREYADCAQYPAPHILSVMGFGRTPEDVSSGAVSDMAAMREFFTESVAALAHGLGVALDDISESRDFVLAPRTYAIKAGTISAGTIAGQRWRWTGSAAGRARIVQETFWITAFDLGPGWPATGAMQNDTQWQVTIEGTPSLRCTFEPRHSFVADAAAAADYNPSGLATAMAAINSLVPLCAASPGVLTSADLPLPRGRGALR